MNQVIYLILRRMRAPLLVLIAVYTISILGMVLVPGSDAEGKPWQMDFFHAFYVVSYTATIVREGHTVDDVAVALECARRRGVG